ncbi:MAG TPA: PASTA domain-containing protein, partial [Terrimesophilobacter sp.]|nr:PASTA domain-containing protein [Terrimesophilobacter sp.]
VNVYDQGQDADTAYLVMEYLPGITLRELLQEHPVLTTEQAMDIMDAVLSGLAAAHRNGIVHRDLKPENVLLADDGRIKISDFGLARAATAQTATGNALLGTIAYLSPELVTRGIADARSDIYAVGIMLYEMLAGEQPFKGEQPFQIAQQHANDTVPTPSSKNPKVPAELDELVLWATARDPEQRPRDARAMLEQLHETQRILDSGQATPTQGVPMPTMVMPSGPLVPTPTPDAASESETQVLGTRVKQRPGPMALDSTSALSAAAEKRKSRGAWLFALVLVLATLAGATGWYFGSGPGSKVIIPVVAGEDVASATAILEKADLEVSPTPKHVFSVDIEAGKVAGTDPEAGTAVAHGGEVALLISDGPKSLPMPKLAGKTEDAARDLIGDSFDVQESQYQFDPKAPENVVIAAWGVDKDGAKLDLGTVDEYWERQPVTLIVSLGPVPDVEGLTVDDAVQALQEKELLGSTSAGLHDWSDTVEKGKVIGYQPPEEGTAITKGTLLQLIVSDGVEQVEVPDVVGQLWSEAERILRDLGFVIELKGQSEAIAQIFPNTATVQSIDPGPGTTVDKGSTVKVRLQATG